MRELFGLGASHAVGVRFSFEEFVQHGGGAGGHADGWGVAGIQAAMCDGSASRSLLLPVPAHA